MFDPTLSIPTDRPAVNPPIPYSVLQQRLVAAEERVAEAEGRATVWERVATDLQVEVYQKDALIIEMRAAALRGGQAIETAQARADALQGERDHLLEMVGDLEQELEAERLNNGVRDYTAQRQERQLTTKEREIAKRDALWDAQQTVTRTANRVANVAQGLADNPYWPQGLKNALRFIVRESGYELGDRIAERGPILYLTNDKRIERSGMHRNTIDKWMDVLKAGGYVDNKRTMPVGEGRPYHEWWLIGDAVNALWDTIATAPLPDEIRARREELKEQAKVKARQTREKHEQVERDLAQVRYDKKTVEMELLAVKTVVQQQPTDESLAAELAAAKHTITMLSTCHGCQAPLEKSDYLCATCRAFEPAVPYGHAGDAAPELFTRVVNNSPDAGREEKISLSREDVDSTYFTERVNNSDAPACTTCGAELSPTDKRLELSECSRCRHTHKRYRQAVAG